MLYSPFFLLLFLVFLLICSPPLLLADVWRKAHQPWVLIDSSFCVASSGRGMRYALVSWRWRGCQWGHEQTHTYCQTSWTQLTQSMLAFLSSRLLWTVTYEFFSLLCALYLSILLSWRLELPLGYGLPTIYTADHCLPLRKCFNLWGISFCSIRHRNATWEISLGKQPTHDVMWAMPYRMWSIFSLCQKV